MLSLDGEYFPVLGSNAINDHISLAHTLNEASPWIQIDLATERCVKGVTIWNRINPSESNIYTYIYYIYVYMYIYIYIHIYIQCTTGYAIHYGTEANGLHKQGWPD